ncbi:hypothetical protein, partial [Clostridium grantii]
NNNKGKIKKVRYDDDEIYDILDEEILQADKEYDKLMRVNDSTFLRVKEIKIDLLKRTQLEGVILKYEVNDDLAKSLLNLSDKAIEDKENNKYNAKNIILLYTPKKYKNDVNKKIEEPEVTAEYMTILQDYYYTGYNNKKYLNETVYTNYSGPFETVKKGYTTSDYWNDTLTNVTTYCTTKLANQLSGGTFSIMKLFIPDPFTNYPATSGDIWQAALYEIKYRKHTSIYAYDSYAGWYYQSYAYAERGSYKFKHHIKVDVPGASWTDKFSPTTYMTSTNYYSLDKKVYDQWYYSKGFYFERYEKYKFNSLIWYESSFNNGYDL